VKGTTALSVMRAGLALQAAYRLALEDDTCPVQLAGQLGQVQRLAARLVDVPMPPGDPLAEEQSHVSTARCPSCGLARLVTPLSTPECPRCHAVHSWDALPL
jgi:hypothetical protein